MTLRIAAITLDVHDLKRAISFWNAALGYELAYESDAWTMLAHPSRKGVGLGLQVNPEEKTGHNRAHVDLFTDDVEREVERLASLGATRADWPWYPEGSTYVVMLDPDGNEFCVVPQ